MKPWHVRDPHTYALDIAEVEAKYPLLHASIRNDVSRIAGTLPIREGTAEVDHFLVEINLPVGYPNELPIVREIGGRIPHALDRHVIPSSGECCVLLPDQRWELWPRGSSLLAYIDGPLRNYFLGQALVERGDPWPFGEWAHGLQAKLDYYNGLLGTDNQQAILQYLRALEAKQVEGHWECPCLSGRRLRDCHFTLVRDLRGKIPQEDARHALRRFAADLKLLNDRAQAK